MLAPFLSLLILGAAQAEPSLETIGRLAHPAIREASGIIASCRHPGVYWVHNDSGNAAALFAVRRDGTSIRKIPSMARISTGKTLRSTTRAPLRRRHRQQRQSAALRAVYRIDEPDPAVELAAGAKAVNDRGVVSFRYPPEGRFDAEGLVIDRGRAVLVSKTSGEGRPGCTPSRSIRPAPWKQPATPQILGVLARLQGARRRGPNPAAWTVSSWRSVLIPWHASINASRAVPTSGRPSGTVRYTADLCRGNCLGRARRCLDPGRRRGTRPLPDRRRGLSAAGNTPAP